MLLLFLSVLSGIVLLVACGQSGETLDPPAGLETHLTTVSPVEPGVEPSSTPTPIMLPTVTPEPTLTPGTQAGASDARDKTDALPVSQPEEPHAPQFQASAVAWILDIAFIDERYGWVLGRSTDCGLQRICPVAMSMTRDGGETWHAIPAPATYQSGSIAPGGVEHIRFANRSDGWAFGPSLFSTHDGGLTWKEYPRMGEIVALEVTGRSVWAIERTCADVPPDACNLSLLVSTIDDQEWQPAPVQPALQNDGLQLVRPSEQQAWILHRGVLFKTDDGGMNWTRHIIPCGGTHPQMPQISSIDAQNLALLCTGSGSEAMIPSLLYISSNGGEEWQLASEIHLPLDNPQETHQALNDFAMPSPDRAFIAMARSTLFSTTDNGTTWNMAITAEDMSALEEGGGVWRVYFADEQHGWSIANIWNEQTETVDQVLYHTDNGGENWKIAAHMPLG